MSPKAARTVAEREALLIQRQAAVDEELRMLGAIRADVELWRRIENALKNAWTWGYAEAGGELG